tara:strand:+ start:257 stop:523 length:267 start_codon:yes stop_codon:yes gene_type:complete
LSAKVLKYYPQAIAAADIVAEIEKRVAANPSFRCDYECLFIAARSTRPSMEFSLYAKDLNSPDWQTHVIQTVQNAERSAAPGEAVYFD